MLTSFTDFSKYVVISNSVIVSLGDWVASLLACCCIITFIQAITKLQILDLVF